MVERMRDFADMGSSSAGADARLFEPMGKKGCSHATMMVYAAKDVDRVIHKGDFLFHFRDGTSAEDLGVFLYSNSGKKRRPSTSTTGAIRLSGKDDKDLKGRTMYIFAPKETREKVVASIEWVGDSEK